MLDYRHQVSGRVPPFHVLVAYDLDSDQILFAEPYSMPLFSVTDPDSGEPVTAMPDNICQRTWLGNGEILRVSCDSDVYLSRVTGETLGDTRLLARGAVLGLLTSRNHEISLLSPVNFSGNYQMYDHPIDRFLKLEQTADSISYWLYTLLL